MTQVVSVLGALAILAAYAGNQFGRLRTTSLVYTVANAVGASILTVVAAVERQWGFLLLESVWMLVALAATARLVRGPAPA
jgi:hypothetical protein